jgi:methyl-accepting chemotaxis protein
LTVRRNLKYDKEKITLGPSGEEQIMNFWRRRRVFIDSRAQLMIAFEVVLHSLLLPVMISFILFVPPFAGWFSRNTVEEHQGIAYLLWEMNLEKWPLFLGLAVFIGMVSILFSHHLVGPAYRFRVTLQSLTNRDLTAQVRLRKHDYLKEMEAPFNQLIGTMRADIGLTVEKMRSIEQALAEIEPAVKSLPEKELNLLRRIHGDSAKVREVLSNYKV